MNERDKANKLQHAKAHLEVLKQYHPKTRAIEVITDLLEIIDNDTTISLKTQAIYTNTIYLLWRTHRHSSDRTLCGLFSTREHAEIRSEHENKYGHAPWIGWHIEERKVE